MSPAFAGDILIEQGDGLTIMVAWMVFMPQKSPLSMKDGGLQALKFRL